LTDEQVQGFAAQMASMIPLGRTGEADEVAKAVLFLACGFATPVATQNDGRMLSGYGPDAPTLSQICGGGHGFDHPHHPMMSEFSDGCCPAITFRQIYVQSSDRPMTVPRVGYVTYRPDVGGLLRNVGDRVIFQGIKNLMTDTIGLHNALELDVDGAELPERELDLLIFCGTPQVSRFTSPLPIHRKILSALDQKRFPILNIGAGSFFFNNQAPSEFLRQMLLGAPSRVFLRYADFDLLTVRDRPAQQVMQALEVPAHLLPCPGFFSTLDLPQRRRFRKLISPLGFTSTYWDQFDGSIFDLYVDLMREFDDFVFLAHDQSDIELLETLGADYHVCEREDEFLKLLSECSDLLTFRIHSALPAQSLGARVLLLGFDNRLRMAQETGVPLPFIDMLRAAPSARELRAFFESIVPTGPETACVLDTARRKYRRILEQAVTEPIHSGCAARARRKAGQPRGGPPPEFFFTLEENVVIPASMMSTPDRVIESSEQTIMTELTSGAREAFFGPYVRLPRGVYELQMQIDVSGTKDLSDIDLIVRYTTGVELARKHLPIGADRFVPVQIEFPHSRETPKIEVQIHMLNENPRPSGTIALTAVCFKRTGELLAVPATAWAPQGQASEPSLVECDIAHEEAAVL
jgi:hypothetical protein